MLKPVLIYWRTKQMTSHDSKTSPAAPMLLPEFDPVPALWERIRGGNARRLRLRRVRQMGGIGLAFAVVAALVMQGMGWSIDTQSGVQGISDGRVQSQQLQDQLEARGRAPLDSDVQARLRLVDGYLQAAYDQGADESELNSLWALRNQLLELMVRQDKGDTRLLTRI